MTQQRFAYNKQSNGLNKSNIIELETNPVRDYIKSYPNVIFSRKALANKLNLHKRQVTYYAENSSMIRRCESIEVGSGKSKLNIYTYNSA